MRRATTPTHNFQIPIDPLLVKRLLLTYTQNGKIILEKTEQDMTVTGSTWSVKLTQEEANLFEAGTLAQAQIRVLTTGGDALAGDRHNINILPVSNDEVLT